MNIIIEEIVNNVVLQIEEVVSTVIIEVSEMQVPGADGKSAYESALDGGFLGTELEFNKSLSIINTKTSFIQVDTYNLMLAITTPLNLTIVKVLNDENKGINNTIYQLWPDGTRMWIAATEDI